MTSDLSAFLMQQNYHNIGSLSLSLILTHTHKHTHSLSHRAENIYACTAQLSGFFSPSEDVDLSAFLMQQNYHNIHHLYPMIPWYRYKRVWVNHEKEFRELGTPLANWLGPLHLIKNHDE